MALELIREVDPNYSGSVYRARLDLFVKAVGKQALVVRSILLKDGAEFDEPGNIAPDSWFSFRLRKDKPKKKEKSGVILKPSKGKKVRRNIPLDQFQDWNG